MKFLLTPESTLETITTHHFQMSKEQFGRWTKKEHEQFLQGLHLYGRNWKQIESLIPTRSCAQIRSHAQKFFRRMKLNTELDESPSTSETTQTSYFSCVMDFFDESPTDIHLNDLVNLKSKDNQQPRMRKNSFTLSNPQQEERL